MICCCESGANIVNSNGGKGFAVVLAAVVTLVSFIAAVTTIANNGFKMANDFESSPLNPANRHKLSWHEVRSNKPKPVKGLYCSTIEITIRNDSQVLACKNHF
jgi:hypothetical protein